MGLIQKSTCTALNDTRAQSLQSGARGLGGRIMKDPPIEGECVPHFFHSRVSRWTSKPSELRFPSQILSVSWCWIILIPCPIKLLITFVWKCFMKTAFLAAVSCGSQKTTLTYMYFNNTKRLHPEPHGCVVFVADVLAWFNLERRRNLCFHSRLGIYQRTSRWLS